MNPCAAVSTSLRRPTSRRCAFCRRSPTRDPGFAASASKAAISARLPSERLERNARSRRKTLAVDHVLPATALHGNDLWNLMPADRVESGRKSDAIPSADILHDSRDRRFSNWALLSSLAPTRFASEAEIALTRTPLPKLPWETPWSSTHYSETADMAARQPQVRPMALKRLLT